jgi:hypothetical protein
VHHPSSIAAEVAMQYPYYLVFCFLKTTNCFAIRNTYC